MDRRMMELKIKNRETMKIMMVKLSYLIELCTPNCMKHKKINENSFLAVNIILLNLMCAFNINDTYM